MPFAKPSTAAPEADYSDQVQVADLVGKVLVFEPKEYKTDVQVKTQDGVEVKDAVDCSITVIDEANPAASQTHDNMRLFQGRLIGKTKRLVGQQLLGVLVLEKLSGRRTAYDLEDATPGQEAAAEAWLKSRATSSFVPASAEPPL